MLQTLYIQNYALIDTLDINFERGFSVITGETGAGKSIILGAIGLLLGQRADTRSIKVGAQKCVIEAHFNLTGYGLENYFEKNALEYDNGACILRRELYASGKSRAFINDTPAPLAQMKELGEKLIDIHSQHQNLLLNKEEFQLNMIDILAEDSKELADYRNVYVQYRTLCHNLDELTREATQNRTDEDYLRFQLEQLEEASLKENEQNELETEADQLNHAEEIKNNLYAVGQYLNPDDGRGILPYIKEVLRHLHDVLRVYPPANELIGRLESCYIELKDIASEVESSAEQVEFNPERLIYINERLNNIYSLEQKHRVQTVEELIALQNDLRQRLESITSYDERLEELLHQKAEAYKKVMQQAATLTTLRKQAAKEVEKQMKERLIPLGIPNVRFEVEFIKRSEPDSNGIDRINFLFSANKNGVLQNIADVASGGEIARVMLSIKAIISGAVKLPTIIFDEIDTGVSGKIAEKMACIMQEMGHQNRQVISITHLPQIAAMGEQHYRVYKEDEEQGTVSRLCRLSQPERIEEIAHMLSGETLSEAAINNAKELLNHKF